MKLWLVSLWLLPPYIAAFISTPSLPLFWVSCSMYPSRNILVLCKLQQHWSLVLSFHSHHLTNWHTKTGLKLPTYTPQPPTSPGSSSSGPIPTIMHLSIRPYAPLSDGDLKKKKKKNRGGWLTLSLTYILLFILCLIGDFTGTNAGEGESENNCCSCVIS